MGTANQNPEETHLHHNSPYVYKLRNFFFSIRCWCLTCRLLMPLLWALTISLWLASSMWRVRLARTCVASELGRVAPTSRPRNSRSITAAATSSIPPRSRLNPDYSTYAILANLCCAHRPWVMSLRSRRQEGGRTGRRRRMNNTLSPKVVLNRSLIQEHFEGYENSSQCFIHLCRCDVI